MVCGTLLVLVLVVVLVLEKRFLPNAFLKYTRISRASGGDSNPASGKTAWGPTFVEGEDDDEDEYEPQPSTPPRICHQAAEI